MSYWLIVMVRVLGMNSLYFIVRQGGFITKARKGERKEEFRVFQISCFRD
jgi:hypothetical protein